jgi:hypothetical protein
MQLIMTGMNLPFGNFCFAMGGKAIQNITAGKE